MNLIEKIKTYESDPDYFQTLLTIYFSLSEDEHSEIVNRITKSEAENKKLFIDDSDLDGILYDGVNLSMIKMK